MRVRVEIGDNAGRGCMEIFETKTVETDNFRNLFRELKREFIKEHKIDDLDYLHEYSEIDEEVGEFYIGFEEGQYIGGWKLI